MSFITSERRETGIIGPAEWASTAKSRVAERRGMHDHGAESFIKINLDVRAAALCRVEPVWTPRLVWTSRAFSARYRKAGRPQSGVKSATPCVWECPLIYRLFVAMPTILNLKRNKFRRVMKPVEAYKAHILRKRPRSLSSLSRDGNSESGFTYFK